MKGETPQPSKAHRYRERHWKGADGGRITGYIRSSLTKGRVLVLRRKDGHVLVGRLLTLVEVAAKGVNLKACTT